MHAKPLWNSHGLVNELLHFHSDQFTCQLEVHVPLQTSLSAELQQGRSTGFSLKVSSCDVQKGHLVFLSTLMSTMFWTPDILSPLSSEHKSIWIITLLSACDAKPWMVGKTASTIVFTAV